MFNNKSILITGGTGSFGNQFLKFVTKNFKPKRLVIYSRDELKQYEMNQKFSNEKYEFIRFFLGDVRDYQRLDMAMKEIDYVIHAAALKQVPSAEYNPMECIKTNIYGAENVIKSSLSNNVKKIIALSTDKAANPINLYGASKLVSDKIFVAANNLVGKGSSRFSVVRYGNVLNSRGSVVPLFKKYIESRAEYLPITSDKMTRFWITLNQSVDFVYKSFQRMQGGEVFVPKLPSLKIVELAKAMAPNLKHKIIGLRPGEKIHEVMCPRDDSHLTISFDDHYVIKPSIKFNDLNIDYLSNPLKEKGKQVKIDFEYSSKDNIDLLDIEKIKTLIDNSDL